MTDAIIIGAGLGGLGCAAKLARAGLQVLVFEKNNHIGGTSAVFRRGPYLFPMGPLSFSFPGRVGRFLEEVGLGKGPAFRRNHFQLVSPHLDIIYSREFDGLRDELAKTFPSESRGIDDFFSELGGMIASLGGGDIAPEERQSWAASPAKDLLNRCGLRNPHLRALLGSQGTGAPSMSLLNLAIMWRAMSAEGIWFPEGGIDGLCRMLEKAVVEAEGEVRLGCGIEGIVVENGRAVGVRIPDGGIVRANWIVSNVDYKTTVLDFLPPKAVPPSHLQAVDRVPYTESELCVYLGVKAGSVDLGRMRAPHLFFRREDRPATGDPEDFDNMEIEICRWSENLAEAAPEGREALVLRVPFSYERVVPWGKGDRVRGEGYKEYKSGLARKLIMTVESVLPGLSRSTEVLETATPLTYRDWGRRRFGSIAGWTWTAEAGAGLGGPFLVRTPVPNLLAVGIYAARELVYGGVPTALHTADLAADAVLEG